jgi:hypothetical protein
MDTKTNESERSFRDRRRGRAGGRRLSDAPPRPPNSPQCPVCLTGGAALQVGEADGGWWFVCEACDHMWDERARAATLTTAGAGEPH